MEAKYVGVGSVYSDITLVGDQLYLSGVVAQDLKTGEMRNGSIEEEAELVLDNIQTLLEANGSSMEKVIRVEIYLTDFSERDRMNQVYARYFPTDKMPSRVCVGTTGLACDARVEMMVHAYR